MKNKLIILLLLSTIILSCGGDESGASGQVTSPVVHDVISSGSSSPSPLEGVIIINWTYPNDNFDGFRVYLSDKKDMSNQFKVPNSPVITHDIEFPASIIGTNKGKQWWFTIEVFRGTDTAISEPTCFTPLQGMDGC